MSEIHYIKYLRDRKGEPISQIATRLGVNWRTAKKYADQTNWNQAMPQKRKFPIMEPYRDLVDTWLLEDQKRPKKQRHTAKRIYDRLKEEHGFLGSDRTVRVYVAKRRKELLLEEAEPYLRLEHPGGEAQCDFGEYEVIVKGELVQRHMLILSFPYSNMAYAQAVPRENTECLLESLKRLFQRCGGVPRRIWFDNPTTMVKKIKKYGERDLTQNFERFSLHYGFEPIFCNPSSGNEKGNVESKVGYVRRNWLVPTPAVSDLKDIQRIFDEKAPREEKKLHYLKGVPQGDLWREEQSKLFSLPLEDYEVFRLEMVKANSYGEVVIDQVQMPCSAVSAKQQVWVKYRWDSVEILDEDYQKITDFPRPYSEKNIQIDHRSMLRAVAKRPRAFEYSLVKQLLPTSVRDFLLQVRGKQRESRIWWLHRILKTYPLHEVEKVVTQHSTDDITLLELYLYQQSHPQKIVSPIQDFRTPQILQGIQPDLTSYDRLQKGTVK